MLEVSCWKDTSSVDSEVSQVHRARVHVFLRFRAVFGTIGQEARLRTVGERVL